MSGILFLFFVMLVILFFAVPAFNACWDWWENCFREMFNKK